MNTTKDTPTPETDALRPSNERTIWLHARRLERERDAARADFKANAIQVSELTRQLTALREHNKQLAAEVDACHATEQSAKNAVLVKELCALREQLQCAGLVRIALGAATMDEALEIAAELRQTMEEAKMEAAALREQSGRNLPPGHWNVPVAVPTPSEIAAAEADRIEAAARSKKGNQ